MLAYLKNHLEGKYSRKTVIEVRKNFVSLAVFDNWILSRKRDAAQDDDNHNESVEERVRDDAVDEYADAIGG